MNNTLPTTKKPGRKPIGTATLTPAERQRRYREKLRSSGGKDFLMTLGGLHLVHVEVLATLQGITPSEALRILMEKALDRYVAVMHRAGRMSENGATPEACEQFLQDHLYPELPPIEAGRGES
ncbi:hypothetical protein [Massilia sp. S19_KUP03_FR1]|uniref:hypothetical protein n=1 Tax=Massilia sp. S19_KUP03_FR1 TaxID=3025503 RepID=UPI002FCCEA1D